MKHVLQLNVAGHGYSTYAGSPRDGFKPEPLGLVTAEVSQSILQASASLDAVVRRCRDGVSVTMRHDVGHKPVLAYGCFFATACDEKGRPGLVLVHALELDAIESLVPVLEAVIESLTDDALFALETSIALAARDAKNVDELLVQLAAGVARRVPVVAPSMLALSPEASDVVAVEHDCRGAASLAWLLLARAMSLRAQGWSITDGDEGGRFVTRARGVPVTASRTLRGSEVLHGGVREYLQRGVTSTRPDDSLTQRESLSSTTVAEPRRPTEPSSAAPLASVTASAPVSSRWAQSAAGGLGAVLGAALAAIAMRMAGGARGGADGGCDAGAVLVVQARGCDASEPDTAVSPADAPVDAGSTDDVTVSLDGRVDDSQGQDASRRGVPRRNGMLFPVHDRPRLHLRN